MLAVEEREISFLDNVNVVSSTTKDLLLKMLTKDPSKRINWKDLFERELTYAESKSYNEIRNKKY
jgi:serine/threonine-protein kinase ULK/ATG1